MSRLTDEELSDVVYRVADGRCHVCLGGARSSQAMCTECHGTGAFNLSTSTMESVLLELTERRAADLTGDDLVALNGARVYLRDSVARVESGWRRDALSVLDRLLSHAGGDK